MPQFDVQGARQAGYSDDEILGHLTQTRKFDIQGALDSGYSKPEIIAHLAGQQPEQKPSAFERYGERFAQFGPEAIPGMIKEAIRPPETAFETAAGLPGTVAKRFLYNPAKEAFERAKERARQGRYSEAAGYGLAAAVPVAGPMAAEFGEIAGQGDVPGLLGAGAGMLATAGLAKAVPKGVAVTKAVRPLTGPRKITIEWAEKAVGALKDVRQKSLTHARALYPEVKSQFDPTTISEGLDAAWKTQGSAIEPSGIRAAKAKLLAGEEATKAEPFTMEQLRTARQELWTYRRNRNLPPDEYRAYRDAYHYLTDQMRDSYQAAGKLPEFLRAEKNWAEHMDTFYGRKSPIRKALEAETPSGDIESGTVARNLASSDVARAQLGRLGRFGVEPRLGSEAGKIRAAKRYWEEAPTWFFNPLRVYGLRHAVSYALTRPVLYRSLRRGERGALKALKQSPKQLPPAPPPSSQEPPPANPTPQSPITPIIEQPPSTRISEVTTAPQVEGQGSRLIHPGGENIVQYKIVEADSVVPSHNPSTFSENPQYPKGIQERQYAKNKNAQAQILKMVKEGKWDLFVNSDPTPINGPPQITPEGIVLGGNARAMALQRAYLSSRGQSYRHYLIQNAEQFGIPKETVQALKKPILVREIQNAPAEAEGMRQLGRQMNQPFTKALSEIEQAVSAGRSLSATSANEIGVEMTALGEGATLREAMAHNPMRFRDILLRDGVLQESDLPRYFSNEGALTLAGKDFIENALLGAVVGDAKLLSSMPASLASKLEKSAAALIELGQRQDAWNIVPAVQQASRLLVSAQIRRVSLSDLLAQRSMFSEGQVPPQVVRLAKALEKNPTQVRAMFQRFASEARQDIPGQETMFGKPDPAESFRRIFGE